MRIDATGLEEATARMAGRGERVRHLEPALTVFGESIVKQTDDCFRNSVDWDGNAFEPLSDVTIAHRVSKSTGGRKNRMNRAQMRTKLQGQGKTSAQITKALRRSAAAHAKRTQKTRAALLAPGGIKILIDSARAVNSNHIDPPKPQFVMWSAVGYLGYHMSGTARMPARNPTPFVYKGKAWTLHARAQEQFEKVITTYVMRGTLDEEAVA